MQALEPNIFDCPCFPNQTVLTYMNIRKRLSNFSQTDDWEVLSYFFLYSEFAIPDILWARLSDHVLFTGLMQAQ